MKSSVKRVVVSIAIALVLTFSLAQVPKAYSAEWSAPENMLSFLRDVVGLDLAKYNATLVSDRVEYPADLGGLAQEIGKYTLESNESIISITYKFRNNTLSYSELTMLKGSPLYSQPLSANVLDTAKSVMQRYQNYLGASYCQAMRDMLDTVTEVKTMTATAGNMKFDISGETDSPKFSWIYTSNGIDFTRKGMSLQFENGLLTYFIDNWHLYRIGSDSLNVSAEEAIRIAREAVPKNYSYQVTLWNGTVVDVTGLNPVDEPVRAELLIGSREPLTLYPYWHVHLYFDKVYLSNIYGWNVYVWADTGEVMGFQTKKFMGDLPSEADPSSLDAETEPSTSLPEDSTSTQPPDTPPQQTETTPTPTQSPTQPENTPESPTAIYIAIAATVISIPIAIAAVALKKRRK